MTEAAGNEQRPSPAAALERRFDAIWRTQMQDMPMVNEALRVQALGFRPWQQHWLGVLVTPWFMNLMLLPRETAHWPAVGERESRHYVFPAGVFEFIGGRDGELGDYQACSLFSPMFEFADPEGAAQVALAALDALFDTGSRLPGEVPPAEAAPPVAVGDAAGAAAASSPALSKRDFLFGTQRRPPREP